MKRCALVIVLCLGSSAAYAQAAPSPSPVKSTAEGFFIGGDLAGVALSANGSTDSGAGGGLQLGYGFSPQWALYMDLNAASIHPGDGSGNYTLAHADIGARLHFNAGPHPVVPFVQFALAGRDARQNVGIYTAEAKGGGVTFGGGFNAHFSPSAAFQLGIMWTVGSFGQLSVNGIQVSNATIGSTSARIELGLVWFTRKITQ